MFFLQGEVLFGKQLVDPGALVVQRVAETRPSLVLTHLMSTSTICWQFNGSVRKSDNDNKTELLWPSAHIPDPSRECVEGLGPWLI
ncbi:hypothetical protein MHYP_G00095020 [Metynnis hypsauchen]